MTGGVSGVFLTPRHLVGHWESPDGARRLPLWLEAGRPVERVRALPGGGKLVPREAREELGRSCPFEVTYPELEGLADRDAQGALNRALQAEARAPRAEVQCGGGEPDGPYGFDGSYRVLSAKRTRAVSLEFYGAHYRGYARPATTSRCKVFDPAGGEPFALGRSLRLGAPATLSRLVTSKLRAELEVNDLREAGYDERDVTLPDVPNLCLLDDKVLLRLTDDDAAHSVGEADVELSFAELRPLMAGDPRVDELLR